MGANYRNRGSEDAVRFHVVIELGGIRQHLLNDHPSQKMAYNHIEDAALDELEVLNDCPLTVIDDAIMQRYIAKRIGDNCIEIRDKKKNNEVVNRYTIYPCEKKNSHDGRPRWFYRGYLVNTNSKKNRYCVCKGDERITVRSALTAALACIDDLCAQTEG